MITQQEINKFLTEVSNQNELLAESLDELAKSRASTGGLERRLLRSDDMFKDLIDAEMAEYSDAAYADHGGARDQLERFAEAIARREREACAKACEEIGKDIVCPEECAEAIRMRSND